MVGIENLWEGSFNKYHEGRCLSRILESNRGLDVKRGQKTQDNKGEATRKNGHGEPGKWARGAERDEKQMEATDLAFITTGLFEETNKLVAAAKSGSDYGQFRGRVEKYFKEVKDS